jgi:hypothetical protein
MINDTDIQPALTAEEWKHRTKRGSLENGGRQGEEAFVAADDRVVLVAEERQTSPTLVGPPLRHALAALALYGKSFGFTRADVKLIETLSDGIDRQPPGARGVFRAAQHLAARIAALLPPK